jgi:acyl carrier protein
MNSLFLVRSLLSRASTRQQLLTLPSRAFFTLKVAAQRPFVAFPKQSFSGSQQLNENEVIELVEGKVFEVLKSAAKCNHAKLSRTATFEELGFDSLDGVELVLAMEEHFGFDLSNQDAEKITSVMDAIQIFHSYITKLNQPAEAGSQ